jgi:transcriptional regulator with XRE-family HTH domain
MTIGAKIKALRKERGFTLAKLAEKISVSSAFLSNVERNQKKPSVLTLKRISEVLNTSVSYLLEVPAQNATGQKIRFLREARGLSIEDLGEISELAAEEIQAYEDGLAEPDLISVEKLATALNYSVRYFLENAGSPASIGSRLKSLRKLYDLSIIELAERAGVSPGLISQIENDKTVPLLDTLDKIAACLDKDSSYFLLDQEDSEALFYSLSPDVREMLGDPRVQAVVRAVRDFNKDELRHILDHIHYFKKTN